jgi:hypothetical protein
MIMVAALAMFAFYNGSVQVMMMIMVVCIVTHSGKLMFVE